MHRANSYCFVDFDLAAPFVKIDMHPDKTTYLDGLFFTMKRFLSGSPSSTVLLYNKRISLINQTEKIQKSFFQVDFLEVKRISLNLQL